MVFTTVTTIAASDATTKRSITRMRRRDGLRHGIGTGSYMPGRSVDAVGCGVART
jgi:hypothetical protein